MTDGAAKAVIGTVTENKGEDKKQDSTSVEPKDFFWDQFIKYISSAILALTLLNITVEFIRREGVLCFHPSDTVSLLPSDSGRETLAVYELARGQAMFLNSYCAGSIPTIEYFSIYILVHGLLLVAPHLVWSTIHKGDFNSFFSIAGKIDLLRSSETGEYSEENFDHVKKLEKEYGNTRGVFFSYIVKLSIQFLISIATSAIWLRNFSFSFNCPHNFDQEFQVTGH